MDVKPPIPWFEVGDLAPEFEAFDSTGKPWTLVALYRGAERLVLHLMCCRCTGGRDLPDFGPFGQALAGTGASAAFAVVDRAAPLEELEEIHKRHGFDFPVIARETREESVSRLFNRDGALGYDRTYVLGSDRRILWAGTGPFGAQVQPILDFLRQA